ncbi:MAG: tRNA guanosine(34) transglycosylase Tgt [Treponema sp.]|jgi:queuine tRNA-ribosyltransferase|nr:tRNA guanosine(34) transglycosylase Tgt [Treponema sp.]
MSPFNITHTDAGTHARAGVLTLPHGAVETPAFMPVGTSAAVKALSREDLAEIGFNIILSNTYHLALRPGPAVLEAAGGLHRFMAWDRNILTDSGGFQIFSLAPFRKITEEGAAFRSHIDGSYHLFSPEKVMELQVLFGSDIQMQLDVCTGYGVSRAEAAEALRVTAAWMARGRAAWEEARRNTPYRGLFFPIMQGNFFPDLRAESAARLAATDPPGAAIGGLSVGEPPEVFEDFLAQSAALLPAGLPRYVMGIGTPRYILAAIEQGIDLFDCVLPTRTGRTGRVFTRRGHRSLKHARNTSEGGPIDPSCSCKVCRSYSLAYLRHLFKTGEILCSMLASYHNLYFLQNLVLEARAAIREGVFGAFKKAFLADYAS